MSEPLYFEYVRYPFFFPLQLKSSSTNEPCWIVLVGNRIKSSVSLSGSAISTKCLPPRPISSLPLMRRSPYGSNGEKRTCFDALCEYACEKYFTSRILFLGSLGPDHLDRLYNGFVPRIDPAYSLARGSIRS